ncbi:unnamed protein product [Tilletia controversa]|nr:hypothetical protein CF328_g3304 [Tilletia controversa]CAD6934671.1 unnamed protein product [Tilletia controversa]
MAAMSEARPGRAAPGAGDEDFPLLDELIRAHPNHLLKPSLNPRRDLACLITLDTNNASGQASAAGAGAGPGGALNAHQAARARLIAMARARALGGAAAAAAAAAGQTVGAASSTGEPKRGPSVLVSLFRTQGAVFRVWQVSVPVQPSLFEARKTSDGKFIEEEERVAVGDVAWSPDGTRLALSLTFTRTTPASAAGPSSQAVQSRHAHLLQILSVENGVQLSAIATGTRPGSGQSRKLQWIPIPTSVVSLPQLNQSLSTTSAPSSSPFSTTAKTSTPFSLKQISSLPALPILNVAALEKVGKPQNANMPHYMRAQQQLAGIGSAGATAQQAIDRALPSEQARLTGVGPLARLGSLYGPGEVLESGLWGRKGGGGGKAKGGAAASVGPSSNSSLGKRSEDRELSLLCAVEAVEEEREGDLPSSSSSTHLDFVLDGTVSIGSVQIGNDSTDIWRPASFTFSSDVRFASLSLTNNITGTLRPIVLHLPFTPSSSYDVSTTTSTHSPPAVQLLKEVPPPTLFHPTLHLSQLASYLRLYLAYALDAATLCSRMWAAETGRGKRLSYGVHGLPVPETAKKDSAATGTGGTAEWGRLLREAASNEGADIIADLLVVLLTGRASTAMESLLLNTVTQGMMRNMEASSTDTLSHIRSLCGDSILPACERVRLLLSEVRGCARWSQRFGALFPRAEEGHPTAHVEALSELHRLSELAIELCRRVVKQAERELLVLDEFYKWWRFERERQDYLRTHKTDPLLAIVHDVLSVSEFVHRGLVNPQLAAYLDGGKVSVAAVVLPSRPSGLGINMVDDSTEASAVLDSRGRVTMQKADSTPADAFPAVDEVMQSVDPVPTRTLQQTLANLKVRVLENRQMGSSIAPRRPLPTRQNQAARLRARELFLGPATDFGDGNGDGDGDGRDALTGRTLEGMLWQLVNGVADVIDPALRRSMGAYTGVQDGDELAT